MKQAHNQIPKVVRHYPTPRNAHSGAPSRFCHRYPAGAAALALVAAGVALNVALLVFSFAVGILNT